MATQTSAQQDNGALPKKISHKCSHRFCRICIEEWLKSSPYCPACRDSVSRQLMKDYTLDEIINEHESKCEKLAELQTHKEKLEQNYQPMTEELRHLKEEVLPKANTTIEEELRQTSYLRNEDESKCKELAELQTCKMKLEQNCLSMTEELRHLKEEVLPEANTTIEEELLQTSYLRNEQERGSEELAELKKSKEKLEQNCQSMSEVLQHLKEVLPEANTTIEEERRQTSYRLNELESKCEGLSELQTCEKKLEQDCQSITEELRHLKEEVLPEANTTIEEDRLQKSKLRNDQERGSEELAELQKSKEKLEQNCLSMSEELRHLKEEVLPEANMTIEEERLQTSYLRNEQERGSEELAELQKSKEKLEQNCQYMSEKLRHLKEEVQPDANTTTEEERRQTSYRLNELENTSEELAELQTCREELEYQYHTVTKVLRQEMSDLQNELERKYEELKKLQSSMERLEQNSQRMRIELKVEVITQNDKVVRPLQNEHESKCEEFIECQTCKEKLEQDCQSVTEELQHLKEEVLTKANATVEKERRQMSNLRTENAAQHGQIESLKREMKCLQLELARSSEEHKRTLDLRRIILDEHESKCEELAELQTCKEKLEQDCLSMMEELRHLKEEVLPKANTAVEKERRQMSNLQNKLQRKCQELSEVKTSRDNLGKKYITLKKELQYLKDKLIPDKDTAIQEILRQNSALQDDLKSKSEELHTSKMKLKQQCLNMRKELQHLKVELIPKKDKIIVEIQQHNIYLQDDLKGKREELVELHTRKMKREQECLNMGKELQHFKEELIPKNDKIIKDIQQQSSCLQNDLKSKSEKLVELHRGKMKLEQRCLNMEKELQHLKEELIPKKDKIIKGIQQQNSFLQDNLKSKREELVELHTCKMKLEQQCLNIGKELQHLKEELIPKKDKISKEIQQQNSYLRDDLKSKRKELVELHTGKMKLEQQYLNMGKELQHLKEELIPKKDKIIKEIQQHNSYLQVDLRNKGNEVIALQKTRENLKQRCDAQLKELKHLTEEVIPEKDRLNDRIRQQSSNLQTELQSKSTKLTESQTYRENLKQRCHKLWTEVRHLEGEVIPRKDTITDRIREQNTGLQYDLHRRHKEVTELQQFGEYLEQETNTLRTELRHLKEEVVPNKDTIIRKLRLYQSRYLAIIILLVLFLCLGFCVWVLRTCSYIACST